MTIPKGRDISSGIEPCRLVLSKLHYLQQLPCFIFIPRYPSYTSSKLQLQTLQHPTRQNYSAITAYGASKLCNLLFMLEFHCRYGEEGISCTAVHPGNLLPTNLSKNAGCMYRAAFTFLRPLTKSVVSVEVHFVHIRT